MDVKIEKKVPKKLPFLNDYFKDCNIITDPQAQSLKMKNGKSNLTHNDNINSESKSSGNKSILKDKYLENNIKSDENLNEKFKYCIECKQFFCENCWKEKHTNRNEEMKKIIEHKFIPYAKKSEKCPIHKKEIIYYCDDCEEKFCEDDKGHDKHERRPISSFLAEVLEKEGTIDKNMFLVMIVNQNKNDNSNNQSENDNSNRLDSMSDYIKNTLNNKF